MSEVAPQISEEAGRIDAQRFCGEEARQDRAIALLLVVDVCRGDKAGKSDSMFLMGSSDKGHLRDARTLPTDYGQEVVCRMAVQQEHSEKVVWDSAAAALKFCIATISVKGPGCVKTPKRKKPLEFCFSCVGITRADRGMHSSHYLLL